MDRGGTPGNELMYLWSSTVAHRLDDGRASSDDARRMPCVVDGTVQCSPSSCSDVEQPGAFDSRSKSRCFAQGPCCMSYGLPEAVDHVSTPARLRTLLLRFSGACCSRSCARSRSASAARASSRYRTRCRRDRAHLTNNQTPVDPTLGEVRVRRAPASFVSPVRPALARAVG